MTPRLEGFDERAAQVLARLDRLRAADAPTHGGHVLSYVYDSGLAEVDALAAEAMRRVQPVNGLDPTTFTSVAVLESEVVGFARTLLGGDDDVFGSVTTGGTESCLLAVMTARDNWTGPGTPRLLAPVTAHAAFHKAAHYFGLTLDLVPVGADGAVSADALIERMGPDVALVVVSAPSYPTAQLDPVVAVAAAALEHGIDCHVDACIGGFVLPFWSTIEPWDLRVPGVTSLSADLHKFGYAPKGASVLLQRGRDRQRSQYFATTEWPGYPVINPTMLGSRSAAPLAAAWAITQVLGTAGLKALAESCERSTRALIAIVESIDGLRVVGTPTGPLFAVAADETSASPIDPHHWADQVKQHGFSLQQQPGLTQSDGTHLPSTTHLTVTPVTASVLAPLSAALIDAAEEVRGVPAIAAAGALPPLPAELDSEAAWALLRGLGIGEGASGLPERMAPLLALIEALPAPLVERLLTELLARVVEPRS